MIVAYTALHYGSPYLEYAIRSVIDQVDQYVVLYSRFGSHGTTGNGAGLPPSDHREQLQWICAQAAGNKLQWVDGNWTHEGQQRDFIHIVAPGAAVIVVVDYDEIWHPEALRQGIDWVRAAGSRNYRVNMIHYWRSFRRAVLHDPACPIRFIKPSGDGDCALTLNHPVNHMGYAIPDWLMRYKWRIHGHRAELRQDIDWFTARWDANAQEDCHPVGSEFWNPEPIDPMEHLPVWMKQHPYYTDEVIA